MLVVPDTHLPVDLLIALERRSAVRDLDRRVALDFSRIPQISLVVIEAVARAGDEDVIRRLVLVALLGGAGFQDPAQSRGFDLDAEGVLPILAAQVRRPQLRRAQSTRRECAKCGLLVVA